MKAGTFNVWIHDDQFSNDELVINPDYFPGTLSRNRRKNANSTPNTYLYTHTHNLSALASTLTH